MLEFCNFLRYGVHNEMNTSEPGRDAAAGELLWKQYALHVDLYKFYLELSVKVNVFYYAITGSILAYYFQHASDGVARYGLFLPIAFSLAIGGVFFYGASQLKVVRQELFAIRDKLGLETAPEMMVLIVFLYAFGVILLCTGAGLVWVATWRQP
jgi:hypothetical protein